MAVPVVSILMPFRDAGETLAPCLESIASQTLGDFECLCIDDGSTDHGPEILAATQAGDGRFRRLRSPGVGLVAALNAGLTRARAPLVARMDADDLMHPERLSLQTAAMRRDPALTVLGTRVRAFSEAPLTKGFAAYVAWQNSCVSEQDIARDIFLESPLAHPSVMFHAAPVRAAGGYRQGPFPEDYELWLRLHRHGDRLGKLPQTLLHWRDHPARLSRRDPRCARGAFDRLRAAYLAADPRLIARRGRLAIWGAGRRTRQRAAHLLERGFSPIAWVDVDPRKLGNRIAGAPVVPPTWLASRQPRPLVLVYVANHGARVLIEAQLERMRYLKGVDYLHVG